MRKIACRYPIRNDLEQSTSLHTQQHLGVSIHQRQRIIDILKGYLFYPTKYMPTTVYNMYIFYDEFSE